MTNHSTYLLRVLLFISIGCIKTYVAAFSTASSLSIGQRIQQATQTADLLHTAQDLWLPTDEDLPVHLRTQHVHHEKRLRWSAQLLGKLGATITSTVDDDVGDLWTHPALERAVLAAALPFDTDRPEKEGRYLCEALVGVHNLMGYYCYYSDDDGDAPTGLALTPNLRQGLHLLFQRADALATQLPLPQVAEMRWACHGILARCQTPDLIAEPDDALMVRMNARVAALPFDITPCVLKWNEIFPHQDPVERLQDEIPFHFDTIVTRTGTAVTERRGTAWIAEGGIGALAYSGKLMPPQPIADPIRSIMRLVESRLDTVDSESSPFFDCALCNHYPDGDSACKFHTDPEHGSHWERLNCVVAAGSPRRFAFRPIPGHSTWREWECDDSAANVDDEANADTPAVITLFPGDVAQMWGTCNDDFYHAVYPGQERPGLNSGERQAGRISLVLKRAIPRHGGARGHSLAGQGRRRSRRQGNQEAPAATVVATPSTRPTKTKARRSKPQKRR